VYTSIYAPVFFSYATGEFRERRMKIWHNENMCSRKIYMAYIKRNTYRILVGKPKGKRPLGRPRRRWVDSIKMHLREIG
jgi:hypothetical protein